MPPRKRATRKAAPTKGAALPAPDVDTSQASTTAAEVVRAQPSTAPHVETLLAIDPGDVHVGMALFTKDRTDQDTGYGPWRCRTAYERGWADGLDEVAMLMIDGLLDHLVVERFQLYPDLAQEQAGSDMLTSQWIGAATWLVHANEDHLLRHRKARDLAKRLDCDPTGLGCSIRIRHVEYALQQAAIKKPITGVLRARKIASMARRNKTGGHAQDAELHGYKRLYDLGELEQAA